MPYIIKTDKSIYACDKANLLQMINRLDGPEYIEQITHVKGAEDIGYQADREPKRTDTTGSANT